MNRLEIYRGSKCALGDSTGVQKEINLDFYCIHPSPTSVITRHGESCFCSLLAKEETRPLIARGNCTIAAPITFRTSFCWYNCGSGDCRKVGVLDSMSNRRSLWIWPVLGTVKIC